MTTHASILAWWIPWAEEPGNLLGSQSVKPDWMTNILTFTDFFFFGYEIQTWRLTSKSFTIFFNSTWQNYLCFQGKPFNIMIIQVYAPTSNAEEAEVEQFYENLQDLLELTPPKRCPFYYRGLECKSRIKKHLE